VNHPKYSDEWYRRIAKERGKTLEMPPEPKKEEPKPVAAPVAPATPAAKPEPKPTVVPAP